MGQSPSATPWALSSCGLVPSPDPRPWGPAAPRPPTLLSLCTQASGGVWVFSWVRCHRDEVRSSPALRLGALLGSPQHQSGHWGSPSRWLGVGSGQGVQGCSAWGAEAPGSPRAPMLGVGAAACNKCRMLWGRGCLSIPGAVPAAGMLLRGSLSPGTRRCVCGGAGPGPRVQL